MKPLINLTGITLLMKKTKQQVYNISDILYFYGTTGRTSEVGNVELH